MPASPSSSSTRDAAGDRGAAVDLLAGVLDDLAQQPRAVLQAAAIFVGAVVVARATGSAGASIRSCAGIDVDDVEAGLQRAPHGLAVPAPQVGDVVLVHRAAPGPGRTSMHRQVADGPSAVSRLYRFARERRCGTSSIPASAPCSWTFSAIRASAGMSWSSQRRPSMKGRRSRSRVDLDLLGADDRPAALGLDPAHAPACAVGSDSPCRCSAAPGRSGCAPSPGRSAPARTGCRSAGRAPPDLRGPRGGDVYGAAPGRVWRPATGCGIPSIPQPSDVVPPPVGGRLPGA